MWLGSARVCHKRISEYQKVLSEAQNIQRTILCGNHIGWKRKENIGRMRKMKETKKKEGNGVWEGGEEGGKEGRRKKRTKWM